MYGADLVGVVAGALKPQAGGPDRLSARKPAPRPCRFRLSGRLSEWSGAAPPASTRGGHRRSEEHTSELQSLMRNSYAVFCLKKKMKYVNYICLQIIQSYP